MIVVDNPIVRFVEESERKEGISAFMRIRNGEDYLRESIMSVIDQVDEIICVFNNSTDNTERILLELELEYPNKIKVYKYIPIVYPPNSRKYLETPADSVHSLSYYYNYTMSLTTYKYLFKFDDDELFFPGILRRYKEIIEKNPMRHIPMRGINLFDLDNKIYLNMSDSMTVGYDTLFFKYNDSCRFIKTEKWELFQSNLRFLPIENSFYHLKRCKSDRGINNYDLDKDGNIESQYYNMNIELFNELKLIRFIGSDIHMKVGIDPHDLGFEFKYTNKQYNMNIFNELEDNIKGSM